MHVYDCVCDFFLSKIAKTTESEIDKQTNVTVQKFARTYALHLVNHITTNIVIKRK